MGIGVRTGIAEAKTIQQAVDNGGEMLAELLVSSGITPDQIISMSAQTVRDGDRKRFVYTVTLLIREKESGET